MPCYHCAGWWWWCNGVGDVFLAHIYLYILYTQISKNAQVNTFTLEAKVLLDQSRVYCRMCQNELSLSLKQEEKKT